MSVFEIHWLCAHWHDSVSLQKDNSSHLLLNYFVNFLIIGVLYFQLEQKFHHHPQEKTTTYCSLLKNWLRHWFNRSQTLRRISCHARKQKTQSKIFGVISKFPKGRIASWLRWNNVNFKKNYNKFKHIKCIF